jgi:hypothetical protein
VKGAVDSVLYSFVREIGWKPDLLSDTAALTDDWRPLLDELLDVYGRIAHWSSDAIGTIPVENGERWLVQYKTFVDGPKIWRVYERVHPDFNMPTFRLTRRSVEMKWEAMGYFSKWSSNWTSASGGVLRQLVEGGASTNGSSGRSGKRRKKIDATT